MNAPAGTPIAPPPGVFVIFSNRLGCLGSLGVSVALSIALILLLRACNGGGM